ncbi:DUF7310 family coiled-coil domain-containing protein [Halovenus salina]|uniref:DUF7310 domain-containing protein n=1 Tax=Halovenus salina TaxID=1510225 RepID=A0ABD5W125_9EURY|nr:hypothetical protein [Halovenus salina]
MDDALVERVDALERAVTDGDHDLSALATEAAARDRLDDLEDQCEQLEARVAELEAATQALRGYVGNVRAVNEEVETRAEQALSKAESLEAQLQEGTPSRPQESSRSGAATPGHETGAKQQSPQPAFQQPQERHKDSYQEDNGKCCRACGHPHSTEPHDETTAVSSEWDDEGLADDDPLAGDEDDTGPLERFKQLL